ncbi:hypothetical protein BN1708_019313, partial [Verticillium longisporum]
HLLLRLHRQD